MFITAFSMLSVHVFSMDTNGSLFSNIFTASPIGTLSRPSRSDISAAHSKAIANIHRKCPCSGLFCVLFMRRLLVFNIK